MKIQNKFGLVLEKESEVFSPGLLKYIEKETTGKHEGEFPKKFQREKIEFTFSSGAREVRGKEFRLKRWAKSWVWHDRKTIIIFEAVDIKDIQKVGIS